MVYEGKKKLQKHNKKKILKSFEVIEKTISQPIQINKKSDFARFLIKMCYF